MTDETNHEDRREALHQVWADLISDRDTVRREPGGHEIALAVRTLQRAMRRTGRQDYYDAAAAALSTLVGRMPELRAEIFPERLEQIERELKALDAAAVAAVGEGLDDWADAHNTLLNDD